MTTPPWTHWLAPGVLVLASCSSSEAPPPQTGGASGGGRAGSANAASGGAAGSAQSGSGGESARAGQSGSASGGSSGTSASNAGAGGGGAGAAGSSGGALSGAAGLAGGGVAGSSAGGAGQGGAGGAEAGAAGTSAGSAGSAGGGSGGIVDGTLIEEATAATPANWQEHAVAAANGEIFVLGGYNPSATAAIVAYDPESDSWRELDDFIGPFNHANVGVVDEKIYLAGFYEAGGMSQASAQTFVYDPVADEWTERSAMPVDSERAAACVAVLGTKLFLFGGARDNAVVADVSSYDTESDTWEELPPLPETREHCAAGAINGKLYVAAGRTHSIPEFRPNTYEFDPVARTYQMKAPIPTPRGGVAGAVLGNRLFVFGGEGDADAPGRVFGEVEAYDPASDSWEAFEPLLVPRHGFGAAVLENRIYLPGGANMQGGGAFDASSVFYFE